MLSTQKEQNQAQRRAFRRLGNLVLDGYSQPRISTLSVAEPSTSASGAQVMPVDLADKRQAAGAHTI